ncbi:MAG: hypothetical protein PHI90_10075 [Clostridia bacterium]|nr:hypothetical protein [Clostridia bacterium]
MYYWHENNPSLFCTFQKDIKDNYPTLLVRVEDRLVHIRGTLRIKDDKNTILKGYQIDITVPYNFPKEIPEVREIGNEIPRMLDRHTGVGGRACLCFRDAIFLYWNKESTILDFMKKFVEPFFLWQIEFEATGGENKERAFKHCTDGAIQFYSEVLHLEDRKAILKFIDLMAKKKMRGSWNCFCGSGKKIKDCHFELIKEYREKIRRKDAKITMEELKVNKIY